MTLATLPDLAPARTLILAAKGCDAGAAIIQKIEADARTSAIVAAWALGQSSGEIAKRLDDGTTRNAVIGRLQRLGLTDDLRPIQKRRRCAAGTSPSGKPPVTPQPRSPKPPPVVHALAPRPVRASPPAVTAQPRPVVSPVTCEPAPAGGVLIQDLRGAHCRWPIEGPDPGRGELTRYCGARKVDDGRSPPYCARHRALAAGGGADSRVEREVRAMMRRRG